MPESVNMVLDVPIFLTGFNADQVSIFTIAEILKKTTFVTDNLYLKLV